MDMTELLESLGTMRIKAGQASYMKAVIQSGTIIKTKSVEGIVEVDLLVKDKEIHRYI